MTTALAWHAHTLRFPPVHGSQFKRVVAARIPWCRFRGLQIIAADDRGGAATYIRGIFIGLAKQESEAQQGNLRIASRDVSVAALGRGALDECDPFITISVDVEFTDSAATWSMQIEGTAWKYPGESAGDLRQRAIEERIADLKQQDPDLPDDMMRRMRTMLENQAWRDPL